MPRSQRTLVKVVLFTIAILFVLYLTVSLEGQDQEICVAFETQGSAMYIMFPLPSHFITGVNLL